MWLRNKYNDPNPPPTPPREGSLKARSAFNFPLSQRGIKGDFRRARLQMVKLSQFVFERSFGFGGWSNTNLTTNSMTKLYPILFIAIVFIAWFLVDSFISYFSFNLGRKVKKIKYKVALKSMAIIYVLYFTMLFICYLFKVDIYNLI
ncbi:MAG: hypothetical protein V1688_01240 [bacterium]